MEYINQFKTLNDLEKIISELQGFMARTVVRGQHPTIYPDADSGKYQTVSGIRVLDYVVSTDGKWVLPHDQHGLSFCATWKQLRQTYTMFARHPQNIVDVHWVLEGCKLPEDMAFVEDSNPKKKGHYFLVVTKKMPIHVLATNLKWVSDRMSVIRNAR